MLAQQDTGIMLLRSGKNISCDFVNEIGSKLLLLSAENQGRSFSNTCSALREQDFAALESLVFRCADITCCDELACRRTSGGWLTLRALPVCKAIGEGTAVLLTISEIAEEEKTLEERLKDKKRELLYNTARPITFEVDIAGKTMALSDQFRLFFDVCDPDTQSEDESASAYACVAEKDAAVYGRMFHEMNAGAPEGSLRIHLMCRLTGTFINTAILWKSIYDKHGKPIRAVGAVQPIVKYKKRSSAALVANLQLRLDLKDLYLKHTNEYLQELRRYRHDSSNNIIALKAYLRHGDTESALAYLNQLSSILIGEVPIIDTGNPAIDAVVTEKLSTAKKLGITVTQTVGLQPELTIDMMDLTVAVGNCLDNAIEACGNVIEAGDRAFIELIFVEQHGAIIFKMKNSSVTQAVQGAGLPETTKTDRQNHGLGLRNVQRIVKKYGGQLYLAPGQNEFMTSFTLIFS